MNAPVVVEHEVQRNGVAEVRNLFGKSVRKPSEATHRHAHRQVLPLDARSGNALSLRIADDLAPRSSAALAGAVAGSCLTGGLVVGVELLEDAVVDVFTESVRYGGQVRTKSIAGK